MADARAELFLAWVCPGCHGIRTAPAEELLGAVVLATGVPLPRTPRVVALVGCAACGWAGEVDLPLEVVR